MEFDGDVLTIGLDMNIKEIEEFGEFIQARLEYLTTIEIQEGTALQSSALLSLLVSLKRSHTHLNIPFLERGSMSSQTHGTLHWIHYD
ncbi:MAG: hypothetical protein J7J31_07960 [Helicobacteraceae bacterium]|nr:hypothetical protein [Helicobacteraceae bacterium]